MSRILTPEQVAEMLHCSADTVREKTPHIIPGAKFGRDWVYSEDLVVKAVERMSLTIMAGTMRGDRIPEHLLSLRPGPITKAEPPSLTP